LELGEKDSCLPNQKGEIEDWPQPITNTNIISNEPVINNNDVILDIETVPIKYSALTRLAIKTIQLNKQIYLCQR